MNAPLVLGTILAGLGCTPIPEVEDSPPESDTDTDTDDTDPTVYKGEIDASDYPQCEGEGDSWAGPCCVDVYCMERTDSSCPDPDEVDAEALVGTSLGSGDCECASPDGPWQVQGEDGCCYLVGVQSCTGRPMPIGGRNRLAPLRRARWSRA